MLSTSINTFSFYNFFVLSDKFGVGTSLYIVGGPERGPLISCSLTIPDDSGFPCNVGGGEARTVLDRIDGCMPFHFKYHNLQVFCCLTFVYYNGRNS